MSTTPESVPRRHWPQKAALIEALLQKQRQSGLTLTEFSRKHNISQPTMIVGRQDLQSGRDVSSIGQKVLGRIARDFPDLRKHVLAVLIESADDFGSTNQHGVHQARLGRRRKPTSNP